MERVRPLTQQEQRVRMSYDDFLRTFDEDTHAEWVDGEVTVFMPPTIRHQMIAMFLAAVLANYARYLQLGEVLTAPCEMRLTPSSSSREPDILYVASHHLDRLADKRLNGAADLVVEIVSDESVTRDRVDKFYEYQDGGVQEYWLVDPRSGFERVDFWVLDESGRYRPVPPSEDGIYHSVVISDFWIDTNWLRMEELPDPVRSFARIAGLKIG